MEREEVSIVNIIIIAEGRESSGKPKLVSVPPGVTSKLGQRIKKKQNRITIFEEMEPFI